MNGEKCGNELGYFRNGDRNRSVKNGNRRTTACDLVYEDRKQASRKR